MFNCINSHILFYFYIHCFCSAQLKKKLNHFSFTQGNLNKIDFIKPVSKRPPKTFPLHKYPIFLHIENFLKYKYILKSFLQLLLMKGTIYFISLQNFIHVSSWHRIFHIFCNNHLKCKTNKM